MQLGIRLHDIAEAPLAERLKIAKSQGFVCGHIALNKVIKEFSVADEALTPGFGMHIQKMFDDEGIEIAVLGNYLNLATPDEDELQRSVRRYMAHIRMASVMKVGVIGTETGAVNKEYKFEAYNHSDKSLDLLVERLRPIVDYAEKMGVIMAIEPVWKHIVSTPGRAREVLDRISSPNLQIIFDPVNLLYCGNYERQDEVFEEAMELLGPDIAVVHLKDYVIEDTKMKSVAAGRGLMNYKNILRFIKKQKPFIHVTLENTTPENAVETAAFIRNLYDTV